MGGSIWKHSWTFTALRNIELASFLRWFVAVELHDPAYAKRFYSTYEFLEENMMKVWVPTFYHCILASALLLRSSNNLCDHDK